MKHWKRLAAALVSCSLALSGCTVLSSGDDLLQTPKPSKSNLLLQKKLEAMNNMTEISPQSGQYRNTVTFEDLDGDNVDEAIATMREGTNGAISVYIFKLENNDYEQIGCITGQGTAIGELSFLNFSEDSSQKGMIITWTLSNSVERGMTVCGFQENEMVKLAEMEYTDYTTCDLDDDGVDELLTISYNPADRNSAQLYDYQNGQLKLQSQANATQEASSIANITTGKLLGGEAAVFVDNKFEKDNGMQTDIYTIHEGALENIALSSSSSTSSDDEQISAAGDSSKVSAFSTYRSLSMYYCDDVNSDGLVEVPKPKALPGYEGASQTDTLWMIDWYDFSIGDAERVFTTYHSLNEEWLLILPKGWRKHVTAKTISGTEENRTVFSDVETGEVLATIAVFDGTDKASNYQQSGYELLQSTSTKCYAVQMGDGKSKYFVGLNQLKRNFSVIQSGWY